MTFTLAQSASSSSATINGMPVRTPCPISERWQTMPTAPSGVIDTKARGLFTVPCGMTAAPHLGRVRERFSAGKDGDREHKSPGRKQALQDAAAADVLDARWRNSANVLGHVTLPQLA